MQSHDQDNFEEYNLEEEEDNQLHPLPNPWVLIPTAVVMPDDGCRRLRSSGLKPEAAVLKFLLPLCILAGLSDFFGLLYDVQLRYTDLFVDAVISFFTFFLGYYLAVLMARIFLPKSDRAFPLTDYGRLLILTGISSLALYHILYEALRMFDFIIEFFPLWTVFLVYKGMKRAVVNENKATYSLGVMCVVIICSPVIVEWFFSFL